MPTAYTAGVADGSVTTFREFALTCARAMGACIMLRDEPLAADIPEFEPSDYNAKAIEETRLKIAELESMDCEQANAAAEADYSTQLESYDKRMADKRAQKARYEAMLVEARAFNPPTPDHANFKEYMIKQLVDSIDFDCCEEYCTPPTKKSGPDWLRLSLEDAYRSMAHHTKSDREERERTADRNRWVRKLKEALAS
jgi:hypothetical protein